MRVWGRDSNGQWVEVATAPNGDNSAVYLVALIQALRLQPGESPFYANVGIPSQQSVLSQLFPDYYVNQIQQQYSQYFSSLLISRTANNPPTYRVDITTFTGATISRTVPM